MKNRILSLFIISISLSSHAEDRSLEMTAEAMTMTKTYKIQALDELMISITAKSFYPGYELELSGGFAAVDSHGYTAVAATYLRDGALKKLVCVGRGRVTAYGDLNPGSDEASQVREWLKECL
jgi:hypothetical protein